METQAVLNKIIEAIVADIQDEEQSITMHDELAQLFERYEGKQITKRMATAIKKAHPDWTVYYKPDYGMYQINIWGGSSGREYKNYWQFFLGYASQGGVFTMEHFRKTNAAYGSAAQERNAKKREMLEDKAGLFEMAEAYCEFVAARKRWKDAVKDSYYNPSYYDIMDALGEKKR